jgi:hypothetical protein
MKYIMNDLEKEIYKLTADEGCRAPIQYTIRAMMELAHTMSDLELKERAQKVLTAIELLKDVVVRIEE